MRAFGLAAVAAGMAVVGSVRTPAVSTLRLPSSAAFYAVEPLGGRVLISGSDIQGDSCAWLVVGPRHLRVQSSVHANCERPPIAAHPVVPVQFYGKTSNRVSVRIAHPESPPNRVSYGPVVMTFPDVSDTHLEWTYGPGSLWLYDVATRHGAEVVDVSTATGRIVRTVPIPRLDRPLLAANADGLWIASSPETGAGTPAPIYHLAPGARQPVVSHRGGYATVWIVASGHTVWADIASMTPPSTTVRQQIWRLVGPSATAHALASADSLNSSATPVLQPGSAALWTISNVPYRDSAGTDYGNCPQQQLVRIDAHTGRQAVTRTLYGLDQSCLPVQSQAFANGDFYFLSPYINLSTPTTLYRLRP